MAKEKKIETKTAGERDAATGRFKAKLAAKAKEIKAKAEAKTSTFPIIKLGIKDKPYATFEAFIKLASPVIPTVRRKGENYVMTNSYTLPSTDLLVTQIQDYGSNVSYVYFTPLGGKPTSNYMPTDLLVSYYEGDAKDAMLEAWKKHRFEHLHKNLYHDWMIGSDPEIFVEDGKGTMIPAWLFMGSKESPNKTPGAPRTTKFGGHGGKPMYWDGPQAEFTTEPNNCLGWHMDSIAAGMRGIYDQARKRFPDAKLSMKSVYDLSPEILEFANEEHVEFGCMPSFNAYGIKVNMPPARDVNFRSAGGHIHFGIGKTTEEQAIPIVKALDAILAVSCVSLFADFDDPKRRVMYGLPGEYRLPKHGMEYRPLSNAWLCHPMISNLVIDFSRKVVMFGQKGYFPEYWKASEEETINTIIRCDVKKAQEIMERNKEVLCKLYHAAYPWAHKAEQEFIFDIFMEGMKSVVKDPNDFETNWTLKSDWIGHSGGAGKNVNAALRKLLESRAPKSPYFV